MPEYRKFVFIVTLELFITSQVLSTCLSQGNNYVSTTDSVNNLFTFKKQTTVLVLQNYFLQKVQLKRQTKRFKDNNYFSISVLFMLLKQTGFGRTKT